MNTAQNTMKNRMTYMYIHPQKMYHMTKNFNTLENNNNIILLYMTVFKVNVWMNWNGAGYK